MMSQIKFLLASLCLLFTSHVALANQAPPIEVVETTVEQFIEVITNESLSAEDKKQVFHNILDQRMDLKASSQRVLGRHWQHASKEDKSKFTDLFQQVLVKTYFGLLNQYTDEKVSFENQKINKKRYAEVNTKIVIKGNDVPVKYRLIKRKDNWRVYDVQAEGISMVNTFKQDYKSILRNQGLAQLNAALEKKLAKPNPEVMASN
ncbi:ABC transporter substrate-binding protein [Catenovulum sp. SM1970]|uniref:MlaC/ttg2D family ABC transporter substrate-binding protein n=1 Tax=Marinifaba aquimaris TaxID=2741323 RepID=UPI0015733234|nr:ABC transporter substrate-binding protein [Marinifaba aquimaris]NTS76839.1 ABC transporter substrate-binding protein [Marinifaba aquimaris]